MSSSSSSAAPKKTSTTATASSSHTSSSSATPSPSAAAQTSRVATSSLPAFFPTLSQSADLSREIEEKEYWDQHELQDENSLYVKWCDPKKSAPSHRLFTPSSESMDDMLKQFKVKPIEEVKAGPHDIFVMLCSDRNPLFDEQTVSASASAVKATGAKVTILVPTGSLQWPSICLDLALSKKNIDEKKGKEAAKNTERQHVNIYLKALMQTTQGTLIDRWIPQFDVRKTPERRSVDQMIHQLEKTSEKEGFSLEKKDTFYTVLPESTVYENLQGLNSILARLSTTRITHMETHTDEFDFLDYLKSKASQQQETLIVMPWLSIADEKNKFPPYAALEKEFTKKLSGPSNPFQRKFNNLVDTVARKKLAHHYQTHTATIHQDEVAWMTNPNNLAIVKYYVSIYFSLEIPFLALLTQTAHQAYCQMNKSTQWRLCYPYQENDEVFAFVASEYVATLTHPECFEFASTTAPMLDAKKKAAAAEMKQAAKTAPSPSAPS